MIIKYDYVIPLSKTPRSHSKVSLLYLLLTVRKLHFLSVVAFLGICLAFYSFFGVENIITTSASAQTDKAPMTI